MHIRKELGFSRLEFRALPWSDQRMYIEQLSIFFYQRDKNDWDNMTEEQRWERQEPIKPLVLVLEEQQEEWEILDAEGIPPDILGG